MTKSAVAGFVVAGMTALTGCFGNPGGGQAAANDSQAMSTGQFAVDSESQLPDCDENTEAYTAYVRDEALVVKCISGTWTSTVAEAT
jgi:hypothetical protein